MIIRITDARTAANPGNPVWWAQAKRSCLAGKAPHGINQLIMDERVTHVDVFATEVSEIWDWAAGLEGWLQDGKKQLKGEPMESQKSSAVPLPDESLVEFRKSRQV